MKKKGIFLAALWLLAFALAGCTGAGAVEEPVPPAEEPSSPVEEPSSPAGRAAPEEAQPEPAGEGLQETVNRVMYLPLGEDGAYVLVDQQTGSVFTVSMPEEMYGLSGEKITPQELKKGNILEITGDGCMLESYPGQYPGVTKIRVLSQGKPEDADIYQELVDSLWQEPDLSKPPELTAEYQIPLAHVAAQVTQGSWEWSYEDENGQTQTAVACGSHPLQWGELLDENPLSIGEAADIRLLFYPVKAQEVKAVCWPAAQRSPLGTADIPQGEDAALEKKDGEFVLLQAKPGFVYQITASFEAGRVEYAFLTE